MKKPSLRWTFFDRLREAFLRLLFFMLVWGNGM